MTEAPPLHGRTLGEPDDAFQIVEWGDPGGEPEPPRYIAPFHVHHHDDEAWYVLEGTLRFRLGERELDAPAGSAVLARRGTPHTYWNPRREPARYLLVMTPRILRLIEAIHASSARDRATLERLFEQHGSALVDGA
jgi:mannose-6-phosphate isomerase-like protein (cupin superfamily)